MTETANRLFIRAFIELSKSDSSLAPQLTESLRRKVHPSPSDPRSWTTAYYIDSVRLNGETEFPPFLLHGSIPLRHRHLSITIETDDIYTTGHM